jgi:hypothetical protein
MISSFLIPFQKFTPNQSDADVVVLQCRVDTCIVSCRGQHQCEHQHLNSTTCFQFQQFGYQCQSYYCRHVLYSLRLGHGYRDSALPVTLHCLAYSSLMITACQATSCSHLYSVWQANDIQACAGKTSCSVDSVTRNCRCPLVSALTGSQLDLCCLS